MGSGTWKNSELLPRPWDLEKIPNSPPLCRLWDIRKIPISPPLYRLWDLKKIRAISSTDMKHVSISGTWTGISKSQNLCRGGEIGRNKPFKSPAAYMRLRMEVVSSYFFHISSYFLHNSSYLFRHSLA